MLALVVGLVESGFDASGVADADHSTGVAHEIHDHLGTDDESPSGDDLDTEHFCHCVTHGAALAFSMDYPVNGSEATQAVFQPNDYQSRAIPPPVPPPNA